MSGRRYGLVVFDWDGTLVDSTTLIAEAIQHAAADLGLTVPSFEQASHVIGLGLRDALRHAVPSLPPERMTEFVERYRFHFLRRDHEVRPFAGIEELLAELSGQGYALAIATGKTRLGLSRGLDRTGWGGLFRASRCADEGRPKPDPWMLDDLLRELDLPASDAVMIGDTTHDLRMASASGVDSVAVSYGAHQAAALQACGPRALVDSVAQLRAWLLA